MNKKLKVFLTVVFVVLAIFFTTVQFSQSYILEKIITSQPEPVGNGYEETEAPGLKPEYDVEKVEPLSLATAVKYQSNIKNTKAKGRLIIPRVGIDLKIYEGLNNTHLVLGAAEQRPRSEVVAGGIGNYILTAHSSLHSDDDTFLFTPVRKMIEGDTILVTDQFNLYVYKTEYGKIFDRDNPEPLNEDFDDARITLYTCLNSKQFTMGRFVVRGILIDTISLDDVDGTEYKKYFK